VASGHAEVAESVRQGLGGPGLSVVEVPSDRQATAEEHRAFVARLEAALAGAIA
jgi:hypothetical protein